MTAPEMVILIMALLDVLAVISMGVAGFMIYRRATQVVAWAQPALHESKAIAARGKATAMETKSRALLFYQVSRTLVNHVGRKVQTTTRLAREVVQPNRTALQEAARAVTGPDGLAARLSRLHEAGKIAAGQDNGHPTRG